MPNPSVSRDGLLESQLRAYGNSLSDYIAEQVFTRVAVNDFTGDFMEVLGGFGAAFSDMDYFRGIGGDYPEFEILFGEVSGWNLNDFGGGFTIDEKAQRRLGGPATKINLRRSFGRRVMNMLMLRREVLGQAIVQNTTTAGAAGRSETWLAADQVDNPNSDQLALIDSVRNTFLEAKGIEANGIVMNDLVAQKYNAHPQFNTFRAQVRESIGRMVDSRAPSLLKAVIARIWMVPEQNVFIGRSRRNTAEPGQTASLSRVWGNHITLLNKVDSLVADEPNGAFARYQLANGDEGAVKRWFPKPGVERNTISWDEQWLQIDGTGGWDESYLVVNAHG